MGWSQVSRGLSGRISCTVEDVRVKPSLALRASVMFAKQAFMGEKIKHIILHLNWVHLLCNHG